MTILNKDVLLKEGPYLQLVYRKTPLIVDEGEWPSEDVYRKDTFFDLADDLLGCLCSISKHYCPFDPYDLTNLSDATAVQVVKDTFVFWATIIANATDEEIRREFSGLYKESDTKISPTTIKQDLLETLEFIINKMAMAEKNGDTITIVGI